MDPEPGFGSLIYHHKHRGLQAVGTLTKRRPSEGTSPNPPDLQNGPHLAIFPGVALALKTSSVPESNGPAHGSQMSGSILSLVEMVFKAAARTTPPGDKSRALTMASSNPNRRSLSCLKSLGENGRAEAGAPAHNLRLSDRVTRILPGSPATLAVLAL